MLETNSLEKKLIEVPNQSEVLPQAKKKRSGNFCISFWDWTLQIIVWVLIALILLQYYNVIYPEKFDTTTLYYSLLFAYIIYLILEFCSPTCSYLVHKNTSSNAYKKMGILFKTKPVIHWSGSAYHYETRTRIVTDSEGRSHTETYTETVYTFHDSKDFSFYSHRDVSGLFLLRDGAGKAFIKLNLDFEINFAESISYSDYIQAKNSFESWIASHDDYHTFSEKRSIPGLNKYNLIQISDKNPLSVYVDLILFHCFYYCSNGSVIQIHRQNVLCLPKLLHQEADFHKI